MHRPLNGFSLIELVVALAILAAATTIALRATNHLQDQARYTNTTSTLNNIQEAILGPANPGSANGSSLINGFVADTGRLPVFHISQNTDPLGADPLGANGDPLNELIANPNAIPTYGPYSNIDGTVTISVGWQGPYLHLGAGPAFIRDGWGNSFLAYNSASPAVQITQPGTYGPGPGTPIAQITSSANNGQPVSIPNPTATGGFVYNATVNGQVTMNLGTDTVAGYPLTTGPAVPNPSFSGVPLLPASSPPVTVTNQPVSIWVDFIGPDLNQTPPVADVAYFVESASGSSYPYTWASSYLSFSISGSNVTIGPRVLKVYVLPPKAVVGGTTAAQFKTYISNSANTVYATTTLNVTLTPGSQTINLVLPHYSP